MARVEKVNVEIQKNAERAHSINFHRRLIPEFERKSDANLLRDHPYIVSIYTERISPPPKSIFRAFLRRNFIDARQ